MVLQTIATAPNPTGVAYNNRSTRFAGAVIVVVTEGGLIQSYNPSISTVATTTVVTGGRGAYAYRAPELLMKKHYTDKIDIWATGITMIEYYLGDYITDPSIALHDQYPEEFDKMVICKY